MGIWTWLKKMLFKKMQLLRFLLFLVNKHSCQTKKLRIREDLHIRVHVERVIGATKQRFSIFQGPIHRSTLAICKDYTSAIIDKIVMVCCALYNPFSSVVPSI
jgi:hypothetical protein